MLFNTLGYPSGLGSAIVFCTREKATQGCLCGYLGHPLRGFICNRRAIYWYRRRISGPLLERIDLHIEAEPVPLHELMEINIRSENSGTIRERVIKARKIQYTRFKENLNAHCNAQMPDKDLDSFCEIDENAKKFLLKMMSALQLSARSYTQVLKVGRTIAGLSRKIIIELEHIAEAIHFRSLDKPLMIP